MLSSIKFTHTPNDCSSSTSASSIQNHDAMLMTQRYERVLYRMTRPLKTG